MFRKNLFIFALLFPLSTIIVTQIPQSQRLLNLSVVAFGQTLSDKSSHNNELITNLSRLSVPQLFDTANHYLFSNSFDTALICYTLIINTPVKNNNAEHQTIVTEAYNRAAVIYYYYMCDYRSAYDYLIKALLLCEKTNNIASQAKIYSNIGNIYYHFDKYDIAKWYYSNAMNLSQDSTNILILLSNLGAIEMEMGNMDSAACYLNKSLQVSLQQNNFFLSGIRSNIASLHQKNKQYDSAFYYYRLALEEARKNNNIDYETEILAGIAKLFFEIGKTDSVLHYIDLSNTLADEVNFLRIKAENYLTLSKIEELKGHPKKALELYKKYVELNNSIFNTNIFGDINQLQRLYEVSKTNQQIEQFIVEQQVRERSIHYQKTILIITLGVLLLVSCLLLFIYTQKRNLGRAYKTLFEKNIEIIGLQENSSEKKPQKAKKSALSNDIQNELMDKILLLMKDPSIICDPKFSIDRLAELVQSNQNYVSQAINNALRINFRSFLNGYRIREAQRLFSQLDTQKYTIESVTLQVGFKSQSAFYDAFKEITGVTPKFYIKSMQERSALMVL